MIFTEFNTELPDWVRDNIMKVCPYCGCYLVDNSDLGRGMTARKCPNGKCPGHMQHKMVSLAKHMGVKNFGPASALNYIKIHKCTSHMDILADWLGDTRPLMKLSDIVDLACIEGYSSTTGQKELNSFKSFTDYFTNGHPINPVLWSNKEILLKAESYFTIPEPLSKTTMLVMGHGSFDNFPNRGEFFREVNEAFGNFIQVIESGKRKSGISYLIMEKHTSRSGLKYEAAQEAGVPIVTPAEFVNILTSYTHN